MNPGDPNDPLPTTPAEPSAPPPPSPEGPRWGAPPPPPTWSPQPPPPPAPPSWSAPPTGGFPPPSQPPRDRLALFLVLFVFGGLFLVFFGFLALAYGAVKGEAGGAIGGGPRVGVVEVKGVIGGAGGADGDQILKALRRFEEDDALKAVVVRIESPGGAVGPSQEIHDEVVRLAKKKTVVCSLGDLAASGGFYIAVACPRIVSNPGTLTGSIGVISQFPNFGKLAERFDVKVETVKSGKLKDAGNPLRDMTAEERQYWQALIDQVYGQFLKAVAEGRKLPEAQVRPIADGRVITGEEALARKLVDKLGNFYEAVELARTEAKLGAGEPQLVYPPEDRGRFLEQLMGNAAGAVADAVKVRLAQDVHAAQQPGLYFLAR